MMALTFPGGHLKTEEIAATNGNVNTDYTPGSGVRSIVLGGNLTIICDGTVVNRVLKMFILTSGGADTIEESYQSGNITAGQTRQVIFSKNAQEADSTPSQHAHLNIPDSWIIEGDEIFRLKINNGQAGDSYSGRFRVLEFGL
tara:strand:- start:203 stop:631 length:429 start_codon:yes stop_codon:yes gene_type:complete